MSPPFLDNVAVDFQSEANYANTLPKLRRGGKSFNTQFD